MSDRQPMHPRAFFDLMVVGGAVCALLVVGILKSIQGRDQVSERNDDEWWARQDVSCAFGGAASYDRDRYGNSRCEEPGHGNISLSLRHNDDEDYDEIVRATAKVRGYSLCLTEEWEKGTSEPYYNYILNLRMLTDVLGYITEDEKREIEEEILEFESLFPKDEYGDVIRPHFVQVTYANAMSAQAEGKVEVWGTDCTMLEPIQNKYKEEYGF